LKKQNRIKESREFNNIIKVGTMYKNKDFFIYCLPKKENNIRFGIAIGTKLGGAVVRNKLKRQIKGIIREIYNMFPNNKDYIIIGRKSITEKDYQKIKESLINIVEKVES